MSLLLTFNNTQLQEFCLSQYIIFLFQNIINGTEHKCSSEHLRRNKQKMSAEKKTIEDIGKYATSYRVYFRLKLSPISRRCPQWLIFFFKSLLYQNNCKEAMNIGGGQIRGALFNCFVVKSALFCIFRLLPLVSKINPVLRKIFYCIHKYLIMWDAQSNSIMWQSRNDLESACLQ